MINLFWEPYNSDLKEIIIPPKKFKGAYSQKPVDGISNIKSLRERELKLLKGYEITPQDCPAIRHINNYGYQFFCPVDVVIERLSSYHERRIEDDYSIYGNYKFSGDKFPIGDSGFCASWLVNPNYIKINTGIQLFYPSDIILYQGDVPFNEKIERDYVIWSGLESYNSKREVRINDDVPYAYADITFVISLNPNVDVLKIKKGTPLGIIYPVYKQNQFNLKKFNQ